MLQLTAQFVGYSTTYIPYTEIPINTTEAYCRDSDSPGKSELFWQEIYFIS